MSCYDEEMAAAVSNLRYVLTNDDEEGVLDNILYEMRRANDVDDQTPMTWIAVSLERIADALDRLIPKQEEAPTSD